jgi:RNA recognition motif-containing protein
MVRTKVFVGNLSFKTRESELAQEFAAAGHVIGANIITRGPRSLGYGFVEFDSDEEANNAVKIMNKKEIDGRAINVEVAKPRAEEENASGQQQTNGAPTDNTNNSNNTNTTRGGFRGRGRGGFRGGFRGGRGRGGFRGGRGRGGGGGGFRRRFDDNNNANTENPVVEGGNTESPQQGGRRRFNRRQENQGPDTRTESKTTLFVANLPFALDDAGFGKVFADNGLKVKSVHVVQKRNGRSKGFGFAEFDTQDDQQKALQGLNGKKVEERDLIVKVALTEQEGASNTTNNTNNNTNNTNTSTSSPTPTPNNTNVKKEEAPAKKEEAKKEEKK